MSEGADQRDRGAARIGPFELVRLLGRGGMGEVWLARDPMLDRDVALKVLPAGAVEPAAEQRLMREARAASALDHDSIVRVHQLGRDGERLFIAMEYVPGRSLGELLREGGALPAPSVVRIVEQVASALEVAHRSGLIHRDVKPDNLVLREDGRVKVLDFGLVHAAQMGRRELGAPAAVTPGASGREQCSMAKTLPPAEAVRSPASTQVVFAETELDPSTASWAAGTPLYMAPEQARGERPLPAADQFALAATAFELLTGQPLRSGETVRDVLRTRTEDILSAAALPASVKAALGRALRSAPAERYERVTDFASMLRAALDRSGEAPVDARSRRRHLVTGVAVVLAAAVLGIGLQGRRSGGSGEIVLAVVPGNRALFAQLYQSVAEHFSQHAGRPVRLLIAKSYGGGLGVHVTKGFVAQVLQTQRGLFGPARDPALRHDRGAEEGDRRRAGARADEARQRAGRGARHVRTRGRRGIRRSPAYASGGAAALRLPSAPFSADNAVRDMYRIGHRPKR